MSSSLSSSRLPTSNGTTTHKVSANPMNGNTMHSRLHQSGGNGGAKEADQLQRRKCENLISYFTTQIHHLNKELEIEKHSRDTHLAKIAKALLCFEAKLKSDQKQIRQQLYEKDTQLNRLASEVNSLRQKYGVKDGVVEQIDAVAQFCPNCRKQYYFLNTMDVGIQVNKHGPVCRDDIDKGEETKKYTLHVDVDLINFMFFFLENNVRPTSSSEDGLQRVFSTEVRRSKRYQSKRTSGTFREYLNSRNIELAFSDESFNKSSESSQLEHKPIIDSKTKDGLMRKGSIRRSTKSAVAIKCDKNGNKISDKNDNEMTTESMSSAEQNGNSFNAESDNSNQSVKTNNSSFLKKYDDEGTKPKNPQFESNDDWYASASDMDDSDGAVSKPYGYNAVNPVLECVNQVNNENMIAPLFSVNIFFDEHFFLERFMAFH